MCFFYIAIHIHTDTIHMQIQYIIRNNKDPYLIRKCNNFPQCVPTTWYLKIHIYIQTLYKHIHKTYYRIDRLYYIWDTYKIANKIAHKCSAQSIEI